MENPQFTALQALLPLRKSKTGKDVVPSARALYDYLEVGTKFTDWLNRRAEEYGFVEGVDFLPILRESSGGRRETDAALTVAMAKELGMVEKTDKGRVVRQYFIWAEEKLKEVSVPGQMALPTDFASALRLLADSVEEKARLQHQIEEAQPKVDFANAVAVAANTLSMAEAAKWLKIKGMGRNTLCARLRADGVFTKKNEPKQQFIDLEYFNVKAQTFAAGKVEQRVGCTPRVTARGVEWLQKKYKQAA